MAAILTTWKQDAIYDPTNPDQRVYHRYTGIPGGYGSFYYSKVPTTAKLQGVLDSAPSWLTAGIVGLVGLGVGFFGAKRFGGPIRKKLGLGRGRR